MKFKVYSLLNCSDCSAYHKVIQKFCEEQKIVLDIIDIDDPDNIEVNIKAMFEYKLQDIPSTILLDEHGFGLAMKGGILDESALNSMLGR